MEGSFHLTPNEPMIMVHKGWRTSHQSIPDPAPHNAPYFGMINFPLAEEKGDDPFFQNFEFVNGKAPLKHRDPEVQKLVRAYVIKNASRKRRQLELNKTKALKEKNPAATPGSFGKQVTKKALSGSIPNLEFCVVENSRPSVRTPQLLAGLDPHPHLSPIIQHVDMMGHAMWPLEKYVGFNLISPALWFDWAMSDDALFHALLYTTRTYTGLILGVTEGKEGIVHVGKSMRLINERLEGRKFLGEGGENVVAVDESTIGAVSCLALTEAIRGNLEGWRVHMMGIKEMVDMRGGIANLRLTLQLKLRRADLTGSVDALATPFFSTVSMANTIPQRPIQHSPNVSPTVSHLLSTLLIDPTLCTSLQNLSSFSRTLSDDLCTPTSTTLPDQITHLQQTYALRYAFLASPPQLPTLTSPPTLDSALRIGALLYMQATIQEFPSSATGSRNLVSKLRERVMAIKIADKAQGELVVWLLFMGGLEAGIGERMWWVAQLERLCVRLGLGSWAVVRGVLEGLWWVGVVLEERCKMLWGGVVHVMVRTGA